MSRIIKFNVMDNYQIARDTYSIALFGNCDSITAPGQFVNIELPGFFLRRPISVCRVSGDILTLVYKVVGEGTKYLSQVKKGASLDILTGLGNGFEADNECKAPLLMGGGAGAAPMLYLAEALIAKGKKPNAVLGFNTADEVFMAKELTSLGCGVMITTADGTAGIKGFVTEVISRGLVEFDYIYACGPEPMLKAIYSATDCDGEFSFEERMACGFGACMGCSCETKYGHKRICKDGPVLKRGEIKW